jgi:aspartate/methionine/tyrosine aminotransferase
MPARGLAASATSTPGSGIREIVNLAIGRPGVIRLEVGEPDFSSPAHVAEAARAAIAAGATHYTQSAGVRSLRVLLAERITRRTGVLLGPDQVVATAGGVQAIFSVLLALLESGDEVLVPDPGWPNYEMAVHALGGRAVRYPLSMAAAYVPSIDDLEALVTPRTRVLVVNSPSNPTGAVFPRATVEQLADFARAHELWLIADEVYDELVFEGEHVSPFPFDPEHTVTVNSLSKTYAMTGWRVGYAASTNAELMAVLGKLQEAQVSSIAEPAQKAAEAALRGPQECVAEMRAAYRSRRDGVLEVLRRHDLFSYTPHGAFYLMLDVGRTGLPARTAALRLLEECNVAVAPGSAFGDVASQQVRISLATAEELLVEGVERICQFVERHSPAEAGSAKRGL